MTNFRDERTDELIETDLKALYAAEAPDLRFEAPRGAEVVPGGGRWRRLFGRWRPAIAGAGVAAALAVALVAPALRGGETESVSAADVFERASASAQSVAPVDGDLSYHMVATAGKIESKVAPLTTETWYDGEGRFRIESGGPDNDLFGQVVNGDDAWIYMGFEGVVRVAHGPAAVLGVNVMGESIGGARSLADVLSQYGEYCQAAESRGEGRILGRPVYEIVVTQDPDRCASEEEAVKSRVVEGSLLRLWVDQETFLTLKVEHLDPDGTVGFSQTVTEFEVSPDIPESVFRYESPEGVTVSEVADLGQAKEAITALPKTKPSDGGPCAPRKPAEGAPLANEC